LIGHANLLSVTVIAVAMARPAGSQLTESDLVHQRISSSIQKRVPEPFLNRSCHLKRQTSKSSKAYEPWLKPQIMVWLGLAHPIWQTVTKLDRAGPSRTAAALEASEPSNVLWKGGQRVSGPSSPYPPTATRLPILPPPS
jgi:hypothetical protein